MFHDPIGPGESSRGASEERQRLASKLLDEPSVFVGTMVELLRRRSTDEALGVVDALRGAGVVSAREFSSLCETAPSAELCSELLWGYVQMTKRSVEVDVAQGLPALVSLAHHLLNPQTPLDTPSQRRLYHILDRILDARMADDDVAEHLVVASSERERGKLEEIAASGAQERKGYWEALELMCAIYPDNRSLSCVVRALERVGSRRLSRADRAGAQRCVSAVAAHNFPNSFEVIAQSLEERSGALSPACVEAMSTGLAFHFDRAVGAISRYLSSGDGAQRSLACRLCVIADKDEEIEITSEERVELRHAILALVERGGREGSDVSRDLALTALGHISSIRDDIARVGLEVRDRLSSGALPPSQLALAHAEGLSRIEGEAGIVGFKPLSWRRVAALSSNPPLKYGGGSGRGIIAPETEHVFENLALEIGAVESFDEVVALCKRHSRFVDPRSLQPRASDSLSLFYNSADAARFSRHYAELCERGPIELAAALFPEFLSALERSGSSERDAVSVTIGVSALRATAALTSVLTNNAEAREIARVRLGVGDWGALGVLHKRVEGDFAKVYPDLGLAVFALRATIEDDASWQREFLRWWRGVDGRSRDSMDPNALAFVSVAAERSTPGAAIGLLKRLSLTNEDSESFRDIAVGLMVRPEDSVQKVIGLVSSAKAEQLARGLLLSQLLARYLSDSQRTYIVGIAKRSMDELGVLSIDALSTVGALSRSASDALLLLNGSPSPGISPAVHRVSSARAAAQILRNVERGA